MLERLRVAGATDIPVIAGGIIPNGDAEQLRAAGVAAVFTPKDYGLTDYQLISASDAAMLSGVERAERRKEWIVATAWSPHWMFAKSQLRYLDDPKGSLGGLESVNKLVRIQRQLLQDLGREPLPEEIAAELECSAREVRDILRMAQQPVSLEKPIGEEEANRQRFAVGPLEPGFGHTLGNSLRRLLLSSLRGSAVWGFRLDGVVSCHKSVRRPEREERPMKYMILLYGSQRDYDAMSGKATDRPAMACWTALAWARDSEALPEKAPIFT